MVQSSSDGSCQQGPIFSLRKATTHDLPRASRPTESVPILRGPATRAIVPMHFTLQGSLVDFSGDGAQWVLSGCMQCSDAMFVGIRYIYIYT